MPERRGSHHDLSHVQNGTMPLLAVQIAAVGLYEGSDILVRGQGGERDDDDRIAGLIYYYSHVDGVLNRAVGFGKFC